MIDNWRAPMSQALVGGSVIALLVSTAATAQTIPATPAQPGAASGSTGMADIVVTAQRRSESVQKTPIAISVFTSEMLRERGINSARDLAYQTPGFSIRQDSDPSYPIFSIRGLGQNEAQLQFQPAVALYEDGIYASTTSGGLIAGGFYDTQRVEVLKGPQGTLFGRNSTGGAISVVTRLPTGDFGGEINGGGGSNGLMKLNGILNIPISGNDVGLRLVGQYLRTSGYGENLTTGKDLNDQNLRSVRGTFRARTGPLELIVRGDYYQTYINGVTQKVTTVVPGSTTVLETAVETGLVHSPADLANPVVLAAAQQTFENLLPSGRYDMRFAPGFMPFIKYKTYGTSATLAYDVADHIQLKSISAYRHDKHSARSDTDGTPIVTLDTNPSATKVNQFTQELQLNGSAFNDRLKFATGVYYYRASGYDLLNADVIPALNPNSPLYSLNKTRDTSKSAYGQATYTIVPGLNLTGGVRYTDETVRLKGDTRVSDPVTHLPTICGIPAVYQVPGETCLGIFKVSFSNWSFTGGLDYQVTRDILTYAKVSRGFKAGGENDLGQFTAASFGPFKPEIATTYEAGVKSQFFDHHLRANLAVYWTDFKDIQRTVLVLDPTGAVGNRVENAASAYVRGGELELNATPFRRVDLNGGFSYTGTKYKKYIVLDATTGLPEDRSNDPFPGVPKWQLSFAAGYTAPLSFGSIRFGVDGNYQSKVSFDPSDTTAISNGAATQGKYTLLNARVTLKADKDSFEASAFVTNFTNKYYFVTGRDLTSIGYGWSTPGAPRMWGIELTKRF